LAALPLCVPLILHRQEICVEPETGRLELQEGTWPWIVRREFGRGELRWVYLSGGGLSLTSWITLGIEDRTGRRYKLCTEGQEQIEQLEAEAETLARVLGVVAYPTPAFHDARRRIYSGRRERLRAGVTMVSVGAALGLLVMLLLTGRVHWGGEPYSSAMAMLFSFGSLALLAVGAPLVFENGVDRKMARLITDRRRRSV
jgi:hypothetical protein